MTTEIKPARTRVNPPFDDKDYRYMDGFDKGVAWALALGALVILGLNIWELLR
jgi:hypothetical protein